MYCVYYTCISRRSCSTPWVLVTAIARRRRELLLLPPATRRLRAFSLTLFAHISAAADDAGANPRSSLDAHEDALINALEWIDMFRVDLEARVRLLQELLSTREYDPLWISRYSKINSLSYNYKYNLCTLSS